jgi:hypothetical protein
MKMPYALQIESVTLLDALRTACQTHTGGNDNQHFLAVFLDGLLRIQDGQSRAASRAATPGTEQGDSEIVTSVTNHSGSPALPQQEYGGFDIDAELQRLMSEAREW